MGNIEDLQTIPSNFGELLKSARKRKRLTQQQLAHQLGVHSNTISSWELGTYLPATRGLILELACLLALDRQETRELLEASLTALAPYWSVPLPRNLFFTGREEILEALRTQLDVDQAGTFTQICALHGLGGVGKTQIALEYAYRYELEYSAVFWIGAETVEQIVSSLLRIAQVLQLPGRDDKDQQRVIAAVQRWLETHNQWLLIWDNVEDLALLDRFLPSLRAGAILVTTRCQALGTRARGIDLPPMEHEEGMLFLLCRAKILEPQTTREQIRQLTALTPSLYTATSELVTAMGALPLALDQAGAYIEETGCSLPDYLHRYEQQRAYLLDCRGSQPNDHPHSVTTTFLLAMEQVAQKQSTAADMLWACALLHAEAIPEELFVKAASYLGPQLEPLGTDPTQFDRAIAVLKSLALVQRQAETHTFSLHRLVQAVLYDQMSEHQQVMWLRRLSAALNALFPEDISEASEWEQCERLLAHVLAVAVAIPDHAGSQELIRVLCKAANYLHERAQYGQAAELYRRALSIGEQVLGEEHPDLAHALDGLAFLSGEQGRYEQAEALGIRALNLRERTLGQGASQVASSLNTIAILYTEQGKHEQAEPLFLRAIHIWEQGLGAQHPQVAVPLNRLALLYWRQGRYEQAEPLFKRALHIWQQAYGPASLQVAQSLYNLALLYWKEGKYEQAEPLFQQAVHVWQQAYGLEHPIMAYALTGLAILYAEQGRYEQAEPLFQQTLYIWEQVWGPKHHQVAVSLQNLGELAAEQGKNEQAEPLFQRALDIEEQVWGPEHLKVAYPLNSLADIYAKQGKYLLAEELFQRALHIWEQSLEVDHPDMASLLNGLANLSFKQGKYERAESLYQRALRLREEHLGQCHPQTAETLHDLAIFQQKLGYLDKAIVLADRALSIRMQSLGDAHPKTVATRELYTQLVREPVGIGSGPTGSGTRLLS